MMGYYLEMGSPCKSFQGVINTLSKKCQVLTERQCDMGIPHRCNQRSFNHEFQPTKCLSTKSSEPEILLPIPNTSVLNIAFFPHYLLERASPLSLKELVE